jgi:hypothetical protein
MLLHFFLGSTFNDHLRVRMTLSLDLLLSLLMCMIFTPASIYELSAASVLRTCHFTALCVSYKISSWQWLVVTYGLAWDRLNLRWRYQPHSLVRCLGNTWHSPSKILVSTPAASLSRWHSVSFNSRRPQVMLRAFSVWWTAAVAPI